MLEKNVEKYFLSKIFFSIFFLENLSKIKKKMFVLKSSETYGKKILPSALFEGGGSADR